MKPEKPTDSGQRDLFRQRLEDMINMDHELVAVAQRIDWDRLAEICGEVHSDKPGHPPLPTRLMAGLHILKYADNFSDRRMVEQYAREPYSQYFCGEEFFVPDSPFDRSSMTRWRLRMGEERVLSLLRESIAVACRMKAAKSSDFRKASVDTTVQPKNVAFPTDARLTCTALVRLVGQAKAAGVSLRRNFARKGPEAYRDCVRPRRDKSVKKEALDRLRTYLGSTVRDIRRTIADDGPLQNGFGPALQISERILTQRAGDGVARPVYAFPAPEVECIGKGKAGIPWEFGVKVSVSTTMDRSRGGQFVTDVRSLPGGPYDGHTLGRVLPEMERNTGVALRRVVVDRGYRGHNAPENSKAKVFVAGQRRGVTRTIRNQLKRRNAVEPVIGHGKNEHRMGRNYLARARGDAVNSVLAAVGYNFHLLFRWARSKIFHAIDTSDGDCPTSCPA